MSEKKKILIWLPLPPNSSWRGEGISQTVENIVDNLGENIDVSILTTPNCEIEFDQKIKSVSVIHLLRLGKISKKVQLKDQESLSPSLYELVLAKFKISDSLSKLSNFFSSVLYILEINFLCILINLRLKFSEVEIFWFPSPAIYGINKINRKKKVISFWDPFVFEYREFQDIMYVLYLKFLEIYKKADAVITQSEANMKFLVDVMGIGHERIYVINNGSPDYSMHKLDIAFKAQNSLESISSKVISNWPKKNYTGWTKAEAIRSFSYDSINKSILWRLLKNKEAESKVILISTQDRPYKGFINLLKILEAYVESHQTNLQIIFTTQLKLEYNKLFPSLVNRVHEITRVSEYQHAILYSISDLIIHPSFAEGGLGAYPQFEAESLDKPSLINKGRHLTELANNNQLELEEVEIISTDFTNINATCGKIFTLLNNPKLVSRNVEIVRKCRIAWGDVGKRYSSLFGGLGE
jgi:glycosyltransferase involved in cell wall biosynthesis